MGLIRRKRRNEAAGIKLLDEKAQGPWWRRELPHEIATGVALMSFFAFALAAAGIHLRRYRSCWWELALYMGLVLLEEVTEVRPKLLASLGIIAALMVLLVIFRKYIGGGLGAVMNTVFEASEFVQAYVYTKFPISEAAQSNPDTAVRVATVWASCLAGALGALPPAAVRRFLGLGVAAFTL